MKKCMLMFVFLLLTLCIAVLIGKSENANIEDSAAQKAVVTNQTFVNQKAD